MNLSSTFAIGHASGLNDGKVRGLSDGDQSGHDINQGDEAVCVDLDFPPDCSSHHVVDFAVMGLAHDIKT